MGMTCPRPGRRLCRDHDDGVWTFDPDSGRFAPIPALNPKWRGQVGQRGSGAMAWVQAEESWWAHGFTVARRDTTAPYRIETPGLHLYKVRWNPVTWRRACATYGAAHFGKSLLWTGSDLLPLYLLVTVYRVDPMTAGLVFLIGLAVNALADFGIDSWLARHSPARRDTGGRIAGGVRASFPATVLLAPYGPWPLLAATLTFRMAYAGCDVPHKRIAQPARRHHARATSLARCRRWHPRWLRCLRPERSQWAATPHIRRFCWALPQAAS